MGKVQELGAGLVIAGILALLWSLTAARMGVPATYEEVGYADLARKRAGELVHVKNVRLLLAPSAYTMAGKSRDQMTMRHVFVAVIPDRVAGASPSPGDAGASDLAGGKGSGQSCKVVFRTGRAEYLNTVQEMAMLGSRDKEDELLQYMGKNVERVLPRTDIEGRIRRVGDYSGVDQKALLLMPSIDFSAVVIDESSITLGLLDFRSTWAGLVMLAAGILLVTGAPMIASRMEPRFSLPS